MYYIRFTKKIRDMMIDHTLMNPDKECGGFLYGNVSMVDNNHFCDVDGIYFEDKVGTENKFVFGFSYICRGLKKMDELNMDIVGSYHSHGNYPAILSDDDRENLQNFFGSGKITVVYSPKYKEIVGEYMDYEGTCHKTKILTK